MRTRLAILLLVASVGIWRTGWTQDSGATARGDDDDSGSDDEESSDDDDSGSDDEEPPNESGSGPTREVSESAEVVGEREAAAPFQKRLDRAALDTLPARSTGQLLRAVPGLQLSEHGGRGKALQYLTRGFDAEHGTDVSVSLEGIPLNEVSNVHGQGYLDLHFIPPMLVDRLDVSKGPHRADRGDFSIAASADFGLGLGHEGLLARVLGGTDASLEAAIAVRPPGADRGTFLALDGGFGEGVGADRDYHFVRGGGGLAGRLNDEVVGRLFILGYSGAFSSPGVVREDDVEAGRIGFQGAYAGSRGGESRRVLGAARLDGSRDRWTWSAMAWGGGRRLELRNDFTGYVRDAVHGDGRRQRHEAGSGGGDGRLQYALPLFGDVTLLRGGGQARVDGFEQSEDEIDHVGAVHREGLAAQGLQADLAGWVEGDLGIRQIVRIRVGLRVDTIGIRSVVARELDGQPTDGATANSWALVPSPHVRLLVTPVPPLEFLASWGRGLRSPQARGVVGGQPAPVTRSDTVEGGVRLRLSRRLDARAVFFATWLDDELVFDHVAARFSGSGRTRRLGVEATVSGRPVGPLRLEAELAWADGRFTGSGDPIPFAPRWMVVLGAYLDPTPLGRAGGRRRPSLTAGVRAQLLLARQLPLGFASRPSFVLDVTARLDLGRVRLLLAIDNLLGSDWRDGEFAYVSCFDPAAGCSRVPAIHLTAGTAWTARCGVEFAFGPQPREPQ